MIKRLFDVVVSAALLVVLSPILAVIAAAVKRDSPGSVLFRQERVGRHGMLFRIRKYRTMRTEVSGMMITVEHDPRVTKIGRVLRQRKLDELPQLIDVLLGTMSLVGPRPEIPQYVDLWPTELRNFVLSVRPGITDPVSLWLRNESLQLSRVQDPERYYTEILLPQKVALYADYVKRRSMTGDLRILYRTVLSVVRD